MKFRSVNSIPSNSNEMSREELEKKVEEGADTAVREYGEALEKLAEYDKS